MKVAFEGRAPVGDQVVAGIPEATGLRRLGVVRRPRPVRRGHGPSRDLDLGQTGAPSQLLHGVPVAIPGREVHLREGALLAQDRIDQPDALDELRPVEPRDEAHARDHVADRDVHHGLALVLQPDRLLGRRTLRRQQLFQPAERGGDRRILVAQTLEELDAARRRQPVPRQPAQGTRRGVGPVRAEAEQVVRELVRLLSGGAAMHDLLREPAEVVDEEDSEGDRDRPQLADRERLDGLVGTHHAPQALRLEQAVGVRDVRPGHAHHAGVAGEMALGELGQLAVVVGRQVVADLAELFVDDRVVVDEPLGRRRDRALVLDRAGEDAVRLEQDAAVLGDAGLDRGSPAGRVGDPLRGGKRLGVLFEPLDAEELAQDRLFQLGLVPRPPAIRQVGE